MLAFSVPQPISLNSAPSQLLGSPISSHPQQHRPCPLTSNKARRAVIQCGRRGGSGRDFKRRGDGRRPNRVAELIRREISPIIDDAFQSTYRKKERDPARFISVVDVRCSDDLRNARVGVSVLGSEVQKESALKWLKGARKQIRFELAQSVHLKYMPELFFTESEMAQAVKTVNILNMLAKQREEKQSSAGIDSNDNVGLESSSYAASEQLDLNASLEDAILFDDEDDDKDLNGDGKNEPRVVEVTEEGVELDKMSDEDLRRALFKTLESEDVVR